MNFKENILETIGNTPLIKLNKITSEVDALVLAKVEFFNPGSSVKDRMALQMVEDAESDGRLEPGGTIVEGTSGNTGMGLALAAIVKGYKLICVTTDKQSKEKVDILRAVGAEVIVCPTNVEPSDERSYYSVSKRLGDEIPNSWYVNQYDNPSNAIAHYEQTGPEIWEQTEAFFLERDPQQVERAQNHPKRKMALIFRWYLGLSSRWSNVGEKGREADYQIWCGPAMGAFNVWTKDSYLADPQQRSVVDVAEHLMRGAAYLSRLQLMSHMGVLVPNSLRTYKPSPLQRM